MPKIIEVGKNVDDVLAKNLLVFLENSVFIHFDVMCCGTIYMVNTNVPLGCSEKLKLQLLFISLLKLTNFLQKILLAHSVLRKICIL